MFAGLGPKLQTGVGQDWRGLFLLKQIHGITRYLLEIALKLTECDGVDLICNFLLSEAI